MYSFNEDGFVERCLHRLAVEIGARPAGSQAGEEAADFISGEMKAAGYEVIRQEYPCPDWRALGCELTVAGKKVNAVVNTHSPSCEIKAELLPVSSAEEVQKLEPAGKIAVVHGDLTATGFMPNNFDRRLYADEEKDRLIELLIKCKPAAIITVSHYEIPLPLLEDSELGIPSLTAHRDEGPFLLKNAGATAGLKMVTTTKASTGCNIIGRRGSGGKKILLCAHYDTNPGTPGAMDNASGVAALLLLARHLAAEKLETSIELVAFGGEDSWFPGDALYVREYPPLDLAAAINIDGIGMEDADTVIATFNCSDEMVSRITEMAGKFGKFVQAPFYESNHGFFWPLGIPTLAFTSMCMELLGKITHTENDTVAVLDLGKIEQTAGLVREIILSILRGPQS